MPSLTSQSCGDSLPAVCLAGKVVAIYRPPKHPWMPDSKPLNFWQGYKHELLDLLLYLSNGGEKWNLKLCAYKTPFGKSSHKYNDIITISTSFPLCTYE